MKGYLVYEQWGNTDETYFHEVYLKKQDAYKVVKDLINDARENNYTVYCRFEDIYVNDDADYNNDANIFVKEVEIIQ